MKLWYDSFCYCLMECGVTKSIRKHNHPQMMQMEPEEWREGPEMNGSSYFQL
jgi:hypothetical protein